MKFKIPVPQDQVNEFCLRWDIIELAFFGSVLNDDFQKDSDIDVLVRFSPLSHHSLFGMVRMQKELELIFRRKVDLVSRSGVEKSRNSIRKRAILESAKIVYAA